MSVFSRAVLVTTQNPFVRSLVTATPPGRALASRFVAGTTLEEADRVTAVLNAAGLHVSLDLLGEEVSDRDTASTALDGYLGCLDRIAAERLDANISIKLTQLGLSFDAGFAGDALDHLARRALEAGTSVTIDMEDSRFTAATVDIYEAAQKTHGNLGLCLQAAMKRSPDDLLRLSELGGHIRLCKGAYVEPPELAFQTREEVDAAFSRLLEALMRIESVRPAIATHDDRLIAQTLGLARLRQSPFEFQMLYGVRPDRQAELASAGHHMRVYVPYGSEWYAYLTRRLAERPANTMFFLRALVGRNHDSRGGT